VLVSFSCNGAYRRERRHRRSAIRVAARATLKMVLLGSAAIGIARGGLLMAWAFGGGRNIGRKTAAQAEKGSESGVSIEYRRSAKNSGRLGTISRCDAGLVNVAGAGAVGDLAYGVKRNSAYGHKPLRLAASLAHISPHLFSAL